MLWLTVADFKPHHSAFIFSSYLVLKSGNCSQQHWKLTFPASKCCGSLLQTSKRTITLFFV
jgi:hypothetical protein